jgi:hypothetical protein
MTDDPQALNCPLCGTPVTMPQTERVDNLGGDVLVSAVVVTDPGTAHAHVRDSHPDKWAELCEMQCRVNASPFISAMQRKVNGTFLRPGEDVGDLPEPPEGAS